MSDDVFEANMHNANRPQANSIFFKPITQWRRADDSGELNGRSLVECRIVEVEERDEFEMPLRAYPVIEHRFYDQLKKKSDTDIATSPIAPDQMLDQVNQDGVVVRQGLRKRFGATLDEYERHLRAEGQDLPLMLLGDVAYPALIYTLKQYGITLAKDFVKASEEVLEPVKKHLIAQQDTIIAQRIPAFQKRVAERMAKAGWEVPTPPKPATKKAA